MKVLFVDDNQTNRILLEDMLSVLFEDMQVQTLESVKEALELDLQTFDLILTDINMPEINGFDFYDTLKNKVHFTKPIIALTAHAVDGDREKMLMHGFDEYISKPIDISQLQTTIEKYI